MIVEYFDVILVDFSGIFPFKLEKEDILTRQEIVSQRNLETFLVELEKNLGDEFVYIGADLLETKLFHRVITKDGLLELLIGTPVTLLAHYKEIKNAEKFKESLKKTLEKSMPLELVGFATDIEIRKVKKEISHKQSEKIFRKLGGMS